MAKGRNRFRSRNDFARIRDVNRQLFTWQSTYLQGAFPPLPRQAEAKPRTCPDSALAAFAQLCALRMNTRSALISLVGEDHEYVLAEVSKTTPFQRVVGDRLAEPLCMGTCSFDRTDGLAWQVIDEWRKARSVRALVAADHYYLDGLSEHSLVISDLRSRKDFHDSPFDTLIPWMRFFCSVPLRGAQGSVIGYLAVLDDKPRYGVNGEEMVLLEDLADTIVEHLDSMIVRSQRQASDRHLQGLTSFISGKRSLREWWMHQDDARVQSKGRHINNGSASDRKTRADVQFGLERTATGQILTPENKQDYFNHDAKHASGRDGNDEAEQSESDPGSAQTLPLSTLLPKDDSDIDSLHLDMFSRASNLLREALDANGVALVNAMHVADLRPPEERASSNIKDLPETQSSDSNSERASMCEIVGFSVRADTGDDVDSSAACPFKLPRSSLKRLIKQHPAGGVVHFDESGLAFFSSDDDKSNKSSAEEAMTVATHGLVGSKKAAVQTLNEAVKGARTMAFLPLWDQSNSHWQSCVFVWNTTNERYFSSDLELLYLATFGQSVSAELARIQSVASNMAKDTFISSISHELRSPLHGVLAGAEFMKETEMTAFQDEMVKSIETAGHLLLETIDHVLDYSKISTRARATRALRTPHPVVARSQQKALPVSSIDLAKITEDVVENCLISNRARLRMSAANSPSLESEAHGLSSHDVSVLLHIDHRPNWNVMVQSGAWIRILTNLVGNALKYTEQGQISISLHATELESAPGQPKRLSVQLCVEDTGRGMSKSFLAHGLFTPFKQEDPHSNGTGLGLSIVKRLVDSLDGKLWVKSKQNIGTKIRLRFAAELTSNGEETSSEDIDVDLFQLISDPHHEGTGRLENSIMSAAEEWLHCQTSSGADLTTESSSKSICAITEHELESMYTDRPEDRERLLRAVAQQYSQLLVFASSNESLMLKRSPVDLSLPMTFVPQPFGPRKLQRLVAIQQGTHKPSSPVKVESGVRFTLESLHRTDKKPHSINTSTVSESSPSDTGRSTPKSWTNGSQATSGLDWSPTDAEVSRVLLVEDNSINMKLLVALMKKLKVAYHCAVNGKDAVALYRQHARSYILILMDMSMPVMDGFTAVTEIRKHESKAGLPNVHISALTGVTSQESKTRAFDCGVNDFFSKPVQMKELQLLLQRVQDDKE